MHPAEYNQIADWLEGSLQDACPLLGWRVSRCPPHPRSDAEGHLPLVEESFWIRMRVAMGRGALQWGQMVTRSMIEHSIPNIVDILVDEAAEGLAHQITHWRPEEGGNVGDAVEELG